MGFGLGWAGLNSCATTIVRVSRTKVLRYDRYAAGYSWRRSLDLPAQSRIPESLFYRDRLGEVPRLVDVAAAAHGNVVGEELKRQHHHDRRQQLGRGRQLEHEIGRAVENRRKRVVAARRDDDDGAAARLHFLHVAHHLLEDVIP